MDQTHSYSLRASLSRSIVVSSLQYPAKSCDRTPPTQCTLDLLSEALPLCRRSPAVLSAQPTVQIFSFQDSDFFSGVSDLYSSQLLQIRPRFCSLAFRFTRHSSQPRFTCSHSSIECFELAISFAPYLVSAATSCCIKSYFSLPYPFTINTIELPIAYSDCSLSTTSSEASSIILDDLHSQFEGNLFICEPLQIFDFVNGQLLPLVPPSEPHSSLIGSSLYCFDPPVLTAALVAFAVRIELNRYSQAFGRRQFILILHSGSPSALIRISTIPPKTSKSSDPSSKLFEASRIASKVISNRYQRFSIKLPTLLSSSIFPSVFLTSHHHSSYPPASLVGQYFI